MNAKKAKKLRRTINGWGDPANPRVEYRDTVVKHRLVPTGTIGLNGLPEFRTVPSVTRTLSPGCLRWLYQRAKKFCNAGHPV